MSAQTIETNSIVKIFEEAEKTLIKNTKNLLLEKRFKLGEGMCKSTQRHHLKIYEIIENNYCPLNDYIFQIIKNGPDTDHEVCMTIPGLIDKSKIKPADTLYHLWLNKGNIGTFDEFLDMLFNNNVDIWEETEW